MDSIKYTGWIVGLIIGLALFPSLVFVGIDVFMNHPISNINGVISIVREKQYIKKIFLHGKEYQSTYIPIPTTLSTFSLEYEDGERRIYSKSNFKTKQIQIIIYNNNQEMFISIPLKGNGFLSIGIADGYYVANGSNIYHISTIGETSIVATDYSQRNGKNLIIEGESVIYCNADGAVKDSNTSNTLFTLAEDECLEGYIPTARKFIVVSKKGTFIVSGNGSKEKCILSRWCTVEGWNGDVVAVTVLPEQIGKIPIFDETLFLNSLVYRENFLPYKAYFYTYSTDTWVSTDRLLKMDRYTLIRYTKV